MLSLLFPLTLNKLKTGIKSRFDGRGNRLKYALKLYIRLLIMPCSLIRARVIPLHPEISPIPASARFCDRLQIVLCYGFGRLEATQIENEQVNRARPLYTSVSSDR